MPIESGNESGVEQLAAHLMREAFIDFAAVIRGGSATDAAAFLTAMEQRLADALHQVWLKNAIARSRPDLIAAVALRLRGLIREGAQREPREGNAA